MDAAKGRTEVKVVDPVSHDDRGASTCLIPTVADNDTVRKGPMSPRHSRPFR